jgi:precorrin-6A synthase
MKIVVIGIGGGSPEHLTGEAITAMNQVDLFLVADKGSAKSDLTRLRAELCRAVIDHHYHRIVAVDDPERERSATNYGDAVRDWHAARVTAYAQVIARELPEGGTVGFLAWGDPALYDSTIRIAHALADDVRVVPGISSVQLLAAGHRITLNRIGASVHLTTGRRLVAEYSPDLGDVVVLLDGDLACTGLVEAYPDLQIYWGAQLGLPDQTLVAGRLGEMLPEITRVRAALRDRRGWVFDTYLLRLPDRG